MLVKVVVNYTESTQYHLEGCEVVQCEDLLDILDEILWRLKSKISEQGMNMGVINVCIPGCFYWEALFKLMVTKDSELIRFRTKVHDEYVLREGSQYRALVMNCFRNMPKNSRYQAALTWIKEHGWDGLQYDNCQYWSTPPDGYIPIPIPCAKANPSLLHWEPATSRTITLDKPYLPRYLSLYFFAGSFLFLIAILTMPKSWGLLRLICGFFQLILMFIGVVLRVERGMPGEE